eukprot:2925291-Pyramimonas_sp.AAC.1
MTHALAADSFRGQRETASRSMQYARFSNLPARPGPAFPTRPLGHPRPICPSGSATCFMLLA